MVWTTLPHKRKLWFIFGSLLPLRFICDTEQLIGKSIRNFVLVASTSMAQGFRLDFFSQLFPRGKSLELRSCQDRISSPCWWWHELRNIDRQKSRCKILWFVVYLAALYLFKQFQKYFILRFIGDLSKSFKKTGLLICLNMSGWLWLCIFFILQYSYTYFGLHEGQMSGGGAKLSTSRISFSQSKPVRFNKSSEGPPREKHNIFMEISRWRIHIKKRQHFMCVDCVLE